MSLNKRRTVAEGFTAPPLQQNTLNRRNSTASSTSMASSSRKGADYWNNLICLFSGVGSAEVKGVTGVPKEYLDKESSERRSRSSGAASRSSSASRRSSSMFTRRPLSFTEDSSLNIADLDSPRSRKPHRRTDPRLDAVPETDARDFRSPQVLHMSARNIHTPNNDRLQIPTTTAENWPPQVLGYPQQNGNASEPKMIGIWKDGEMHWIREDILSAITSSASTPFISSPVSPQPQNFSSPPLSPRPNMTIQIPPTRYNNTVLPYRPASPSESVSSVYTQAPGQAIQQYMGIEPHMSYPNDMTVMVDQATPGLSPISDHSGSYTNSSEGWGDEQASPSTQFSSNTSISGGDNSPKNKTPKSGLFKDPMSASMLVNQSESDEIPPPPLPKTPTLDQAEHELRQELSNFEGRTPERSVASPTAPPLPIRSRKRESYIETKPSRRVSIRQNPVTRPETVYKTISSRPESIKQEPQPPKKRGLRISKAFLFRRKRNNKTADQKTEPAQIPPPILKQQGLSRSHNRRASTTIERQVEQSKISADAAERVIYHIFEKVKGFDDLFALAQINRGFYSVFKRQELTIIQSVHRNFCPASWELRQSSPTEIISSEAYTSEYTPKTYMQFHERDSVVLSSLKTLIHARCQPFLRPSTVDALSQKDTLEAQEIDNALWRIWTFCFLFGGNKGREYDLNMQIDWLKGGRSTRTMGYAPTPNFGRGNLDGLDGDELYNMTELWNCLKALVSGIQGPDQAAQARLIGAFKGKHVKKSDADSQESLLEEWLSYLVTLGLSTILDIANAADAEKPNSFFRTASEMGWHKWSAPPQGETRASFLRNAVSRVYEEKISSGRPTPSAEATEIAKRRSARFAAELKEMKRASATRKVSPDMPTHIGNWPLSTKRTDFDPNDAPQRGRAPSRQGEEAPGPRTSSQPTSLFKSTKNFGKRSHSSHPSTSTTASMTTAPSEGARSSNVSSVAEPPSPASSVYSSVCNSRKASPTRFNNLESTHVDHMIEG